MTSLLNRIRSTVMAWKRNPTVKSAARPIRTRSGARTSFCFNAQEKDGSWGEFTGYFPTVAEAMEWMEKEGRPYFIDRRGLILGLFCRGHLIKEFKQEAECLI